MALKTRITLGIALIMALWVVAALPPRSCTGMEVVSPGAIAICGGMQNLAPGSHQRALRQASSRLRDQLAELRLADSVRALVRGGRGVRSSDGSVVILYEAPLSADSARAWLALAVGELARMRGESVHSRVIVVLETNQARFARDQQTAATTGAARSPALRFISTSAADTMCIVALRLTRDWQNMGNLTSTDSAGPYGAFLGACSLVARHGPPGPAIGRAVRWAFDGGRSLSFWNSAVHDANRGRIEIYEGNVEFRVRACVNGDQAACPPVVGFGMQNLDAEGWYRRPRMARDFFGYLAASREPDAFSRFWRSSMPMERALAQAFGRPHAELVREWAQNSFYVKTDPEAPSRRQTVLATIGWLSVALIVAFAIGMRRQANL